jgi:hypothetical protein
MALRTPLGCEVRWLGLLGGTCRGFHGVQLWADGSQLANLLLALVPHTLPETHPVAWVLRHEMVSQDFGMFISLWGSPARPPSRQTTFNMPTDGLY